MKRIIKVGIILIVFILIAQVVLWIVTLGKDSNKSFSGDLNYEVNMLRSASNVPELQQSTDLDNVASAKCKDMSQNRYYDHRSPQGMYVWEQFPFQHNTAGENLARGYADARGVVKGWDNSETHKQNLLNPAYTQAGYASCLDHNTNYLVVQILRS